MATLGEIAKSHGFDNVSDYVNHINNLVEESKAKSFNVGNSVKLKKDFTPTHFKKERVLSHNVAYLITEKSNFTLDNYSIKLEGYDVWFCASIFELCT